MVEIVSIKNEDIGEIVSIHIKTFRNFFMTKLGPNFLSKYYRIVLDYPKSIFLGVKYEGKIIGFVAGFLDPYEFYSLMSKRKVYFLPDIILSILKNPLLIVRVLYNFKRVNSISRGNEISTVELASLAVDPQYLGKGFGKLLVQSFLDTAKNLEASYVYLTTDAKNNDYVNKFYQKLGFELYKTFKSSRDRVMNEYRFYFIR